MKLIYFFLFLKVYYNKNTFNYQIICNLIDINNIEVSKSNEWIINLNLNIDSIINIVNFKYNYIDLNWYLLSQNALFMCNFNGSICKTLVYELRNAVEIIIDPYNG